MTKTRDMVNEISILEHLYPVRPIKQSCALPFFHSDTVNEAIPHIVAILKIGENFDYSNTYSAADLFPSRREDKFYKFLLELKEEFPEVLKNIAEYDI
ncbi:hypothetical protein [Lysinibacillus fusiformis]